MINFNFIYRFYLTPAMNNQKPLTDRENFLIASVIMVVSERMKSVSRETRQNILQFIREERYPGVTDNDWKEIAAGIDEHKKHVFGLMVKMFHETQKKPDMFAEKAVTELDTSMKAEMDSIDFDELREVVESSDDPKLREYYLTMKQLKRDFDDEQAEKKYK